ncbi:tail fiber protein [Xanthomonas phage NED111]|uniref:Tail fiber protein n=1 Tax=Xanthomonas phage NED111 TaxID=2982921 RepID=A0AAX3EZ09_9CAUD|nr:tail fiber protein [Xanthomonas phage NED111]
MANHFRLYGRPLMADEVADGLSVTGVLEGYTAGEAYESRLSINNPVGRCTVEVIESTLPSGAAVRVDNITKEVVVKWAAFTEVVDEETLVPNGDFEAGDDGTWVPGGGSNGEGWSIGTGSDYDTDSGVYSARFANIKTGGSDLLNPLIPAEVNDYIRCTAEVQQGASSKGKAGARVSIIYRREDGTELQRNWGNMVSSGSNGNWHQSVAEGAAPKDTKYVQVVLSAFRSKQNKPLWVDTVKWNHKYVLGQNDDSSYFLSIKVTDGLNRVAYWSGRIEEQGIYVTSKLYPFYQFDAAMLTSSFAGYSNIDMLPPVDSTLVGSSFVSWEVRSSRQDYVASPEYAELGSSFVGWEIKSIRKEYDAGSESAKVTSGFISFTLKQHPIVNQPLDASAMAKSAFVSWSFA